MKIALSLCFTILITLVCPGQQKSNINAQNISNQSNAVKAASDKLLKSINTNEDKEVIAANYFNLARELSAAGDLERAEYYINKAIQLQLECKNKTVLSSYYRALAKILELQKENESAAVYFEKAATLTNDKTQKLLNTNDANRITHKTSPKVELQYLNQNAVILSSGSDNEEKLQNYTQMASANIALSQNDQALENYKDALNTVDSNSEQSIQIKSDMANLLADENDYASAIDLQKQLVTQSQNNSSVSTQVEQLRNLSALYFTTDSVASGLAVLRDAYQLAIANGNLKQAKESLIALAAYYEKNKENKEVIMLYRDFIGQLEPLIAKDSSLIDKNLFLINEGKIAELEQQQTLKDELIQRKNRYNYMLAVSVLLLLLLLFLIIKAWLSIRKGNKIIALQSLRREMNPHFIFNSLNSVNQFIANNNEREANKYLSSYSNLMRNIMENSGSDYVTLSDEADQLKKYLELEKLRFADKFDFRIDIAQVMNADTEMVPNMLIQPNVENAIWHGLRYKESIGMLYVKFSKVGNKKVVIIDDNGIGLQESQKIKTNNQKLHESLGLKNVRERISLLNDIYKADIRFEIKEKSQGGVTVKIEW